MIRRIITLAGLVLGTTLAALPARAQGSSTQVGVSIQVSQPGVYGRIDIGQFPKPQVVLAKPVIIEPPVVVVQGGSVYQQAQQQAQQKVLEKAREPAPPVYLWVPPGHRKNWRKHCREYGACGVPVYFVDDRWYDEHVHPKGKGKGHDKEHGKGHDKAHDKGPGHGKGKND
jgi:hypothetical protein